MNETLKCNRCGVPLTPDSPEGLCPRCLIAVSLATQTEIIGETGPAKPPPSPPLPVADIARLFPQLEILECLGRGGMGAVYKARQPRLDRLVALKILSPEKQGNQKFAERFEREARALAKLHHPNIVTVYDFGEVQGNFYLLMEFVDGLTLRQLLQARKLSPAEALTIVPKICEALQYAHEQGIVHRDIKPENILLDKEGRVKIADFGIAKILGDGAGSSLTSEQVIGTPHYMSPEQIEHPQTVDHRADIYSLGVVFYEMLTGELPLGKFQPPSKKVHIDVRLDEIVLRALEKEPERRYQQASEVKTQVETVVATPGAAAPIVPVGVPSTGKAFDNTTKAASEARTLPERRFSRMAIAGAVCAPLSLLPMFWFVAYVRQMTQTTTPMTHDTSWLNIVLGIAGFMGMVLIAPLVTSTLGWTAVAQIRRSAGRILGLRLALFDGLFFPLLMLDTIIAGLWTILQKLLAVFVWKVPGGNMFFSGLDFLIWLTLLVMIILWVDSEIIRRVWRAVNHPNKNFPATSRSSGHEPAQPEKSKSQTVVVMAAWIGIIAIIGSVLALMLMHNHTAAPTGVTLSEADFMQKFNSNEIQHATITYPTVSGGAGTINGKFYDLDKYGKIDTTKTESFFVPAFLFTPSVEEQLVRAHNIDINIPNPMRSDIGYQLLFFCLMGGVILLITGIIIYFVWCAVKKPVDASTPPVQKPDHFWRRFAVIVLALISVPFLIAILGLLAAIAIPAFVQGRQHALALHERQLAAKSDYIGQTWFPLGDSIQITSVERTGNQMTVKGHYDLVSHDSALLALYITTAKSLSVPTDFKQTTRISKGSGDFVLVDPNLVSGLPHVSMYADNGHPFASVYFGTQDETAQESAAGWITNSPPVSVVEPQANEPNELSETRAMNSETAQVLVEHAAMRVLAAIRDRDDAALKELATDERVQGWRDALPEFAFEMREKFHQFTGESFDLHVSESQVRGDEALVKCDGPAALNGKYLALFFVKTADGWKNCYLHSGLLPSQPLEVWWKQFPGAGIPAGTETNMDNAAVSAAQKWLALIDDVQYSPSWKDASQFFQRAVSETAWENSMNSFRKPMGALLSRKLESAQYATQLPGAPDGQYVVMQFDTSFANKKSAVETVTFMQEKDGQWKACGYFIK